LSPYPTQNVSSDAECIVRLVKGKPKSRILTEKERDEWEAESITTAAQYMSGYGVPGSGGIVIGDIKIRFKMLLLQGMKTNLQDGLEPKRLIFLFKWSYLIIQHRIHALNHMGLSLYEIDFQKIAA